MKKYIYILQAFVVTALLTACDGNGFPYFYNKKKADPTLRVSPTDLNYTSQGGGNSVSVYSNSAWTATSDANWLSLSTYAGELNGTVMVTASENPETSERTATVTFANEWGMTSTVTVTQEGRSEYYLRTSISAIDFESGGGDREIDISSNTSWTASCDDTWIRLSQDNGNGDATVKITAEENVRTAERTSTITFTYDNSKTVTVTVTQAAFENYINVGVTSVNLSGERNYADVAIESSWRWAISCDADWITISTELGERDQFLRITAQGNPEGTSRQAIVTVSLLDDNYINPVKQVNITVNQSAGNPDAVIPSLLVPFTDGMCTNYTVGSHVAKFYTRIYEKPAIDVKSDATIISELTSGTATGPDYFNYTVRYVIDKPDTEYYICIVAYDSNGNQLELTKTPFMTRPNYQASADIPSLTVISQGGQSFWNCEYQLGNGAKNLYSIFWKTEAAYQTHEHFIAWNAYDYIMRANPEPSNVTKSTVTKDSNYFVVCTWGIDADGNIGDYRIAKSNASGARKNHSRSNEGIDFYLDGAGNCFAPTPVVEQRRTGIPFRLP